MTLRDIITEASPEKENAPTRGERGEARGGDFEYSRAVREGSHTLTAKLGRYLGLAPAQLWYSGLSAMSVSLPALCAVVNLLEATHV